MTPFQLLMLQVFQRGEEMVMNLQAIKIPKNVGVTYLKFLYMSLRRETELIPT
jgi:hypothetical protein